MATLEAEGRDLGSYCPAGNWCRWNAQTEKKESAWFWPLNWKSEWQTLTLWLHSLIKVSLFLPYYGHLKGFCWKHCSLKVLQKVVMHLTCTPLYIYCFCLLNHLFLRHRSTICRILLFRTYGTYSIKESRYTLSWTKLSNREQPSVNLGLATRLGYNDKGENANLQQQQEVTD